MSDKESEEILVNKLSIAAAMVSVGGRYRHYSGKTYKVLDVVLIEADTEPAVLYQAEYGSGLKFIRPLSDWLAAVEQDGKSVRRFEKI